MAWCKFCNMPWVVGASVVKLWKWKQNECWDEIWGRLTSMQHWILGMKWNFMELIVQLKMIDKVFMQLDLKMQGVFYA
jgi:hypothetical protein